MVKKSKEGFGRPRVYKYGLVPLEPFPEEAVTELLKSNILWNKLVSLHNENREEYEKLLCKYPEYKLLKDKLEDKQEEINKAYEDRSTARMKSRTTKSDNPLIESANVKIEELKKDRKKLYDEIKPVRESIRKKDKFKDLYKQLGIQFNENCKSAVLVANTGIDSSPAGLDATTANQRLNEFKTARDRTFKDKKARLRYHKFDGTGYFFYRFRRSGMQRDGISFEELYARSDDGCPFVIDPFKFLDKQRGSAGRHSKKPRYELTAKVKGGAIKKDKLYVKFVLILHRPLPQNSQINNAQIIRTRTGNRFSYFVCFTVREPILQPVELENTAIGIDLNWRENKGTLDVATIAYENQSPIKVVSLPKKIIDKESYINDKKSKMDDSAAELGKEIKNGMKKMNLPDNHKKIKLWNSVVKLPANRTLSFEAAFKLAGWAINEPNIFAKSVKSRLLRWRGEYGRTYKECHNLRRKILAHRKDYYRRQAAELVKETNEVVLEEMDLSQLAEFKDRDDRLNRKARANRFLAAPAEFRSMIRNAADREGVLITDVPAYYTSKRCSSCNEINKDLTSEKEWQCPSCNALHDRDENAAKNIVKLKRKR